MGGHVGNGGEFEKGIHSQDYVFDSKGNVIVEVLLHDFVPSEITTLKLEQMLDVQNLRSTKQSEAKFHFRIPSATSPSTSD